MVMESESDDDAEDAAMDGGAFQAPTAGATPTERQVEQTPSVDAAVCKAEPTPVHLTPRRVLRTAERQRRRSTCTRSQH